MLVTRDTSHARWLLTPSPMLDSRILAIMARSYQVAPVALHAFAFLSGRAQLLMTVPDRERMATFLHHTFRAVGDAVRAERLWCGPVWDNRPGFDVLDPCQSLAALRAIHASPVLDGLIAHPADWPGVSSAPALLAGEPYVGGHLYRIPLAPLPLLGTSPVADRIALVAQMFDAVTREGEARRAPRPPMGRRWILERDPLVPDPRRVDQNSGPALSPSISRRITGSGASPWRRNSS